MPWLTRPRCRSLRCNGEMLRYFRERRRFTQEELANRAEVCVRVVAKAEAGGALFADTVETLAHALSGSGDLVHPEDLVSDPRSLALQFFRNYAVYERQLVAKSHAFLAENLVARMAGDPREIPFSGIFEGVDGFDRLWGAFFGTVHRPDKELAVMPQVLVVEGNHVFAIAKEIADLPGLPSMGPQTLMTHLRFERGKLADFETHFDTLAAARQIQAWRARGEAP